MKLNFTLILVLVFHLGYSQCADTTKIHKFTYKGKNYEIVKEEKTWTNAAACAVERGGYLVEIEDSLEQIKVFDEIVNGAGIATNYKRITNGGGIAYVWIGATDQTKEGDWLWDSNNSSSGTKFWTGTGSGSASNGAFHNWGGKVKSSINEPDNFGTGQDHGAIGLTGWPTGTTLLGSPGEWNDIVGTSEIYFVIEYDSIKSPVDTLIDNTNSMLLEEPTRTAPYPNPAEDKIYIESDHLTWAVLRNIQGKIVGTFEENELDVSKLNPGTYWINILEGERKFSYPIVIQ